MSWHKLRERAHASGNWYLTAENVQPSTFCREYPQVENRMTIHRDIVCFLPSTNFLWPGSRCHCSSTNTILSKSFIFSTTALFAVLIASTSFCFWARLSLASASKRLSICFFRDTLVHYIFLTLSICILPTWNQIKGPKSAVKCSLQLNFPEKVHYILWYTYTHCFYTLFSETDFLLSC